MNTNKHIDAKTDGPPNAFCWTRFGTEAGETIDCILARKERERLATDGLFLWGIGNSVGPAMRTLVDEERQPMALFSPMRSRPKAVDVSPERVVTWSRATDLNGDLWPLPNGVSVKSRAGSDAGRQKSYHFALVCRSGSPLRLLESSCVVVESLVNLLSGAKLGASQVTAVVRRLERHSQAQTVYPVAFCAELVFPYFVRLEGPVDEMQPLSRRPRTAGAWQLPLLNA